MARVKRGVAAKRRHKKVLEQAKGYYGNKSRSFRAANEQLLHSGQYAFRDRRARKGEFRRLWIQRINAGDPHPRHELQPVHRRPQRGRHRGRPQDPRRPRRARRRRLRRPRRGGQGRPRHQRVTAPLGFTSTTIQRLRRLHGRRSSRSEEGAFVVEGPVLVAEAVAAGWDVEGQFVAPGVAAGRRRRPGPRARPGRRRADQRHRDADRPVRRRAHAGAVAAGLLADAAFVVVADGIADPGNLGTILRSAEAAGVDAVVVTPGTVDGRTRRSCGHRPARCSTSRS